MPSNRTRRILKEFGIAVTTFEDAVDQHASTDEVANAESEMLERLDEVHGLMPASRRCCSLQRHWSGSRIAALGQRSLPLFP